MSLTVEDGTGKTDADTYASIADADSYCVNFGYAEWASKTDTEKEVALRKGTRYVDSAYTFTGSKKTAEQSLQWPRLYATRDGYDLADDIVPSNVVNATIEAARLALTTDLTPNVDRGGLVKRVKVDVIETEYEDGAPGGTKFTIIDMMLSGLLALGKSSSVVELVRA